MATKRSQALLGFSLFDFANTAFTLIFHAYLFPLYLKDIVFHGNGKVDLAWGILLSVSALSAALVSPFIGRIADRAGRWRVFAVVAVLSFASAIGLAVTVGSSRWGIVVAFVVANSLFYLAANLYNSLLGSLVTGKEKAGFSGFAWGFGYVGGIICFLGVYLLVNRYGVASKFPYVFAALFYSLFGVIAVRTLRGPLSSVRRSAGVTVRQMFAALSKERLYLLLGYFLIADTVGAVISFTALYASAELRLSTNMIGAFLLGVQILAAPFTYIVCRLAMRRGTIPILGGCVAIWIAILALFVVRVNLAGMFLVTFLTALVIGSTQALMRSHYSDLLEGERESELFGWYGIATESAAVVAPLLFGVASLTPDGKRLAMGLLTVPLCAGFILVVRYSRLLSHKYAQLPIK